jgi:ligand-binding sensor domain-containing protein
MKNLLIIKMFFIFSISSAYSENPEWITYNTTNSLLPCNYVISLAIDSNDNKWIYSCDIVKFDGKLWMVYDETISGLPDTEIASIAIENHSTVWISTDLWGIAYFDGNNWINFTTENSGLLFNSIFSIAIDDSNNKWFGTPEFTLTKFDGLKWGIFRDSVNPKYGLQTFAIAIDDSNNKWIGSSSCVDEYGIGYLEKFDGINWTLFHPYNSDLPISHGIYSIYIDKKQNKWIGTDLGGLVKFDDTPGDTSWSVYNKSNSGLPDNSVYAIAIDDSGNKWIGTKNGLAKFDDTTWSVWNTENSGLPYNNISCIVIDKYDNKWIGTKGGGLAVFKEGGVVSVEDVPGNDILQLNCYPNPVYGSANIQYYLPEYSHIIIKVFDIFANTIEVLKDEYKERGIYNIDFNTSALPAGIYFYQLQTQSGTITKKMVVVK